MMIGANRGPRGEAKLRYFSNLTRPNYDRRFDPGWIDLDAADKVDHDMKTRVEKADLPDERKKALH
jgi:hypothetical protein